MIAVLKKGTTEKQIADLTSWIESQGRQVHLAVGEYKTIVGLIGDTSHIDEDLLVSLDIIESVKRISEPFKNANRKFQSDSGHAGSPHSAEHLTRRHFATYFRSTFLQ